MRRQYCTISRRPSHLLMYEQAALPIQHPKSLHCSPAKTFLPSRKIFENRVIVGTRQKRSKACTRPQVMRAVLQRVKSASVKVGACSLLLAADVCLFSAQHYMDAI